MCKRRERKRNLDPKSLLPNLINDWFLKGLNVYDYQEVNRLKSAEVAQFRCDTYIFLFRATVQLMGGRGSEIVIVILLQI